MIGWLRWIGVGLAAAAALGGPGTAWAQAPIDRAAESDARRLRLETRRAPLPPAAPFLLSFSNGFTYNTNPDQKRHATGADWHENPDLELDVQGEIAPALRLQGTLDVNTDRYLHTITADNDELMGQIKLAYKDGAPGAWSPYGGVRATLDFSTTFSQQTSRFFDLFAGVGRKFDLDFRDGGGAEEKTVNGLTLDVRAGRQEVRLDGGSNWFVRLRADVVHAFSEAWAVAVTPVAKFRYGDSDDGPGVQRDVLLIGTTTLKWTPEWLNSRYLSHGEIDLAIQGTLNRSTNHEAQYEQLDTGPFLSFYWTF